ncbi:MAG: helix-turn-helix transcriptional regulator [Ghiorsea sp.]
MSIGRRIKEERIRCGFSQQHVAEFFNVTRNTVSLWEGGKTVPKIQRIEKLAKVLNTTVEYLTSGSVNANLSIAGLISAASPRSKMALERINQAVEQGKLSDDDVELLQKIAKRMQDD